MKKRALGVVAVVVALALVGCKPSTSDQAEELIEQNKKILAKLKTIESDIKQMKQARPARAQRPQEDPNKIYKIDLSNAPIKGNPEAAVTLVEYSDFQCPYCARISPLTKQLLEKYPKDLKIAFKHFPLGFHKGARPAAIASMAAQEQGKFWEMHDVLFQNQRLLADTDYADLAQKAGLDVARFNKDMEANKSKYDEAVTADFNQGQTVGVRGTPSLYLATGEKASLSGKKIQNRSVEAIGSMIDAALKGE